jgi:integrase
LQVSAAGTKSWVFRFKEAGKLREMGLGATHTIGLAEAREKARDCRRRRLDGIDPIEARKATRAQARLDAAKAMTFKQCAESYIASHKAGWRNPKHAAQWPSTLGAYVYPIFGALPVQAVDVGLVMRALEPIWTTKPETAGRVRGRIESVLDWAAARGYRQGENPARWRGHLENLLRKKSKVRRVEHHAALPYAEIGAFIAEMQQREGVAARALEFAILTAARTGEVIGAKWDEIDFDERLWTVPAERMKAGKEHRVPLSDAALAVLEEMQKIRSADFVFPGGKARRPLSKYGVPDDVAPPGPGRSNGARVPVYVFGLVQRTHKLLGRCSRNGAGARCRRQGRGGLPARRPVPETPSVDGGMDALLFSATGGCNSGLDRRGPVISQSGRLG